MVRNPNVADAAEIKWFEDSVKTNYNVILDLRNESAVAALALHKWQLYNSNNKVYTQLFRERSADSTLPDYVRTMQTSENSKMVAIILLSLLLLQLPIAYYLLYYRHVVRYRYAVERINAINQLLLSDLDVSEKMKRIKEMWAKKSVTSHVWERLDGVVEEIEAELQRAQASRWATWQRFSWGMPPVSVPLPAMVKARWWQVSPSCSRARTSRR